MVRRLQLLEPERRFSARRAAALGTRIRDGLLRDNKVVPPVLAVLALLVFAWLAAGALIGGAGNQEEQQASNQASLAQTPKEGTNSGGGSGTPDPGVDNRDTDSYAAFGKPKDPFELPKGIEPKTSETTRESTTSRSSSSSRGGATNESTTGRSGGGSRSGSSNSGGGEDFIDQTFPGGSGSRGGPSGGGDTTGAGPGGGGDTSGGPGGGAGQGGNGDLFNSGGDLPVP